MPWPYSYGTNKHTIGPSLTTFARNRCFALGYEGTPCHKRTSQSRGELLLLSAALLVSSTETPVLVLFFLVVSGSRPNRAYGHPVDDGSHIVDLPKPGRTLAHRVQNMKQSAQPYAKRNIAEGVWRDGQVKS